MNIALLNEELSAANAKAMSEVDPKGGRPPTIFAFALDELRSRGESAADWPVWGGLLTLILALIALPTRRQHKELIVRLAGYCTKDPSAAGQIGIMLSDHAGPGDDWIADLLLRSTARGAARLVDPASVIIALGFVGRDGAVEALLPLSARTSNPLAPLAALALARCGVADAEGPILAQLEKKPNPDSIEAAGILRLHAALPMILDIADPASMRRKRLSDAPWAWAISRALVRISPTEAGPALARLFNELDEYYDEKILFATELARLGDADADAHLLDKAAGWTGRVHWGFEPLEAKWEAANLLAEQGHELGLALTRRWYGHSGSDGGSAGFLRGPADRYRMLQALGGHGDASHLPFLRWVEANDHDASEKGWALAIEARRAAARIEWRQARLDQRS